MENMKKRIMEFDIIDKYKNYKITDMTEEYKNYEHYYNH